MIQDLIKRNPFRIHGEYSTFYGSLADGMALETEAVSRRVTLQPARNIRHEEAQAVPGYFKGRVALRIHCTPKGRKEYIMGKVLVSSMGGRTGIPMSVACAALVQQ